MKRFLVSPLFLALSYVSQASIQQNMIVGGEESNIQNHTFVASLQRDGSHYCGASLISPKFVLTAAHCVDFLHSFEGITILLGSQSAQASATQSELRKIKEIHIHPDYNQGWFSLSRDIAIIELDQASRFAPISMIEKEADALSLREDRESKALGWGNTTEGGSLAGTLMEVKIPLVSSEVCSIAYPSALDESMICAGLQEGGKDSCQSDSGGPLIVETSDLQILVGVVSWGHGCARPNKYGVYASVSYAKEWIEEILSISTEE